MKKLFKSNKKNSRGQTVSQDRARMQRSMPGEKAALTSLHYGVLSI